MYFPLDGLDKYLNNIFLTRGLPIKMNSGNGILNLNRLYKEKDQQKNNLIYKEVLIKYQQKQIYG